MHNVFILKTDSDSSSFQKKLSQFLSKYCKETETIAAVYELNQSGIEQAEKIINQEN